MWFKAYYFIFLPQNIVTTFLGERSSGSSSSTFIAWIFYDQLLLLSTLEVLAALFLATSDEAAQARVCCREELHFPLDAHWTLSLIKKIVRGKTGMFTDLNFWNCTFGVEKKLPYSISALFFNFSPLSDVILPHAAVF